MKPYQPREDFVLYWPGWVALALVVLLLAATVRHCAHHEEPAPRDWMNTNADE